MPSSPPGEVLQHPNPDATQGPEERAEAEAAVFIGDRLGIDLYYVALLAFGFRMFKNLAMLRRYLLRDYRGGGHKSMLRNP